MAQSVFKGKKRSPKKGGRSSYSPKQTFTSGDGETRVRGTFKEGGDTIHYSEPAKKDAKGNYETMKGYSDGGMVNIGVKPTNQSTVKATGMGAATRGGNFKV